MSAFRKMREQLTPSSSALEASHVGSDHVFFTNRLLILSRTGGMNTSMSTGLLNNPPPRATMSASESAFCMLGKQSFTLF